MVTVGNVDAALGLRAVTVSVVNCGNEARTVVGYPGVRVLGADGEPYDVTVHLGASVTTAIDDPAPSRITLEPGARAESVLAWRNTVTSVTEPAVRGTALEVTPTKGAGPQSVAVVVDLGNTGKLDVTAWRRP